MEHKPILNIMVDLETASTKENAAILSWAMMPFHTDGDKFEDADGFHRIVSLTSCFLAGMSFEDRTQQWWMKQDPKSKDVLLHTEGKNIQDVTLESFAYLENLSQEYDLYLWSRGIDFDITKIEWCFNKFVKRPLPYKYSHKMDVRTVLKFMGVDQSQFEFNGVKHNSMDDCRHDIKMIQAAYKQKENLLPA